MGKKLKRTTDFKIDEPNYQLSIFLSSTGRKRRLDSIGSYFDNQWIFSRSHID